MLFADYPGYAELLSIMHNVGVKHLSLGPGDEFFGAVIKRQYHSVGSASREYGVPASSIRRVLEELGKLSPSNTVAKSNLENEQQVFEVRLMEHVIDMVRDGQNLGSDDERFVAALQVHSMGHRTAPSGHVSPDASVKLRVSEHTVSAPAHEGFLKEVFPSQPFVVAQYAKLELRQFSDRYLPERELPGFLKKLGSRMKSEIFKLGLEPQIPKWRVGENFYLRDDVKKHLASQK